MQRKVHELREKLIRLKASVGEAKLPQNFTIKNKNFSIALGRIETEATHLANKVKSLQNRENDLKAFFDKLMEDFEGLKRGLGKVQMVFRMAFNESRVAEKDIGDAEDIIEEIKKLLKDARYQLTAHGEVAYKEALKLARDISDLARKMKAIAAEVICKLFFILNQT